MSNLSELLKRKTLTEVLNEMELESQKVIEEQTREREKFINMVKEVVSELKDELRGKDGKSYVLTDVDRKKIADSIKIPIVDRIIEKTEVIKEKPVITEITKVTNEIKEVAVSDSAEEIVNKINNSEKKIHVSQIEGIQMGRSFAKTRSYHKVIYPSQITGTIDDSNMTFYLPEAPKRVEEIILLLDNTPQEPTANFTLTGNRVDFTFAPSTGQRLWAM